MSVQAICQLYCLDLINFEEFQEYLACHFDTCKQSKLQCKKFKLGEISDKICTHLFRFNKDEIQRLLGGFKLNGEFVTRKRVKFTGEEGLCILLRRLSYPCRLVELGRQFHRSPSAISSIFGWMLNYIDTNFGYLLSDLNQSWLSRTNLFKFGYAIENAGSPIKNIWGFIDGTQRQICRPVRNQRQYYSGHKRFHCVKYQGIVCPNGLIARLDGPYIGRRHDSFVLKLSNLIQDLNNQPKMKLYLNNNFHLYGDTGYVNTKYILTNFRNPGRGTMESAFNVKMAELRVVVEWGFAKTLSLFAFVDYKKNQKLLLQPVGKYYRVATILTNCHVCLNGSQVSEYFYLQPPLLEQYLGP